MAYNLYLSYSGRKTYLDCPLKYKFQYIDKLIVISDPKTSFFGSVIGKIFESFYNDKLWASPNLKTTLLELINPTIDFYFKKEKFNDNVFREELYQNLIKYVPIGLEIIRQHQLLTLNSRSEIKLDIMHFDKNTGLILNLGGRADFIHGNKEDLIILDGKASKYRDQYIDDNQLYWYALLHYLKYCVAPTKIGYLFWLFPEDPIKWIEYDEEILRKCLSDTFIIAKKILDKQFEATPSFSICNFCKYSIRCETGTSYLEVAKEQNNVLNSIFELEQV